MINELLHTESYGEASSRTLTWVHVQDDGGEQPRRGVLWAEGPRLKHGETLWAALWLAGGWRFDLVVRPARRHRTRGGQGRYVDPGEYYSDAHSTALAAYAPWRREGWGGQAKSAALRRADGWEREPSTDWDRWVGAKLHTELPQHIYNALSNEG
jgi:hypothetical protein